MTHSTSDFLDGYQLDDDWCREVKASKRTCARYRNVETPGLPFIRLGGRIYINVERGREWLAKRTCYRNREAPAKGSKRGAAR